MRLVKLLLISIFLATYLSKSKLHAYTLPKHYEILKYKVRAEGVYLGYLTIKIQKISSKKYKAITIMEMDKNLSRKFNYYLKDILTTYFEVLPNGDIRPLKLIKDIHEGKWKDKVTLTFDHKHKRIFFVDRKKVPKGMYIPFKGNVYDLPTLITKLRLMSLSPGQTLTFNYIVHKKIRKTHIKVEKGPDFKLAGKSYKTMIIRQLKPEKHAWGIKMKVVNTPNKPPIQVTMYMRINYKGKPLYTLHINGGLVGYKRK